MAELWYGILQYPLTATCDARALGQHAFPELLSQA